MQTTGIRLTPSQIEARQKRAAALAAKKANGKHRETTFAEFFSGSAKIADDEIHNDEPITLDPDEGRPSEFDAPAAKTPATNGRIAGKTTAAEVSEDIPDRNGSLYSVAIHQLLASPTNPRTHFAAGELQELADSIKAHGVLEPLLVRPLPPGPLGRQLGLKPAAARYEIVAGERRYRAAKLAGLQTVPCVIRAMSDQQVQLAQLVENLQREDLSPIEEARAFHRLTTAQPSTDPALPPRPPLTQQQLAGQLGISQGQIANRIRLLDLPEAWQQRVAKGELSASHARELVPYAKFPAVLKQCESKIVQRGGVPALAKWQELVQEAVHAGTEPLVRHVHTKDWSKTGEVKIDARHPQRDELQIVEVPSWRGKEKRCLNAPLAKKLLDEKVREWRKRNPDPAKGKGDEKKSPHLAKQEAERARQKQKRALEELWKNWLCKLIEPRVKDLGVDLMLRVLSGEFCGDVAGGCKLKPDEHWSLPIPELLARLREGLCDVIQRGWVSYCDEFAHICQALSIDPRDAFTIRDSGRQVLLGEELTEAFFELLTDDQARDLISEWKLPAPPVMRGGKTLDPLVHLVECRRNRRGPRTLPLPAILDQFHWSQSLKKKAGKKPVKKAKAK